MHGEPDSEELSCRPFRAGTCTCEPLSVRRSVFVPASNVHLAAAVRYCPLQTPRLHNIDGSHLSTMASIKFTRTEATLKSAENYICCLTGVFFSGDHILNLCPTKPPAKHLDSFIHIRDYY